LEKEPNLQVEGTTDAQERRYSGFFLTEIIGNADAVCGVAGKARNGMLIVYHANWNAHLAETADDPKTLIIAADYNGSGRSPQIKHGARTQDIHGSTDIHAATRVRTEKWRRRASAAYFVTETKHMRGP